MMNEFTHSIVSSWHISTKESVQNEIEIGSKNLQFNFHTTSNEELKRHIAKSTSTTTITTFKRSIFGVNSSELQLLHIHILKGISLPQITNIHILKILLLSERYICYVYTPFDSSSLFSLYSSEFVLYCNVSNSSSSDVQTIVQTTEKTRE